MFLTLIIFPLTLILSARLDVSQDLLQKYEPQNV